MGSIKKTPNKHSVNASTPSRSTLWRCAIKKMFLKISQNSQENTCARVSFLIKLLIEACNFIKKGLYS